MTRMDKEKIKAASGRKKMSKKRKVLLISGVSAAVLAGIIPLAMYLSRARAPETAGMERAEVVKYAASQEFAALPQSEKQKYFDGMRAKMEGTNPWQVMRDSNLSEQERERLRDNMGDMFRQQQLERVKKLVKMSKEERAKEYDRMAAEAIKRMAERRQQGGQRPEGQQNRQGGQQGGGQNRGAANVQRMRQRYEGTDAVTRAVEAEMRIEMRKRMQQAGVQGRGR